MKKPWWFYLLVWVLLSTSCQRPAPAPGMSFVEKIIHYPDPVTYDLKLDVDYDSRILSAVCKIAVKNAGDEPVTVVPLILYRLMEVTSVANESGQNLAFGQKVSIFEDWRELQVNHVRIGMNPPLAPGKSEALVIRYSGPLLGYSEAMRYVKDRIDKDMTLIRSDSLAIPVIGVPSWRTNRARGLKNFEYTVSVTVPSSLIVANGGNLVAKNNVDGKTTYVYTSKVPSWRIDLAISNYEILEGGNGRFKIFAFPADREEALALLGRLTEAIGLYTRWFGPLKSYRGLTVIEIPEGYGSQADAAAIIQEAGAVKDRTKRSAFYHELSHLWNVEAKDPLPSRFESEGLAMLLQHLVEEKLEGKAGAAENAVSLSLIRMGKNFAEHPDWKGIPMIAYGEKELTDLSYRMGQIFFYLLYKSLGEKAFLETLGSFYQDFSGTGATTEQFVEYVKKRSAVPLDKLFNEWVFTANAADLISSGSPLSRILERYK